MKIKPFYFLLIAGIIGILFIFAPLSSRPVSADDTEKQPKVYITNTGNFYHSTNCHYLQSKIPIGLYDAKERGYSACSYCGGEPDGYYSWKDYEDYLDSVAASHKSDKPSKNEKSSSDMSTFWIVFFIIVGIIFIYTEFIAPNKSNKK